MALAEHDRRADLAAAFGRLSGRDVALIVTDTDGVIQRWSEAATAAFGYERVTALGRTFAQVAGPPDDAPEYADAVARVSAGGLRLGYRGFMRPDGGRGTLYGFACRVDDGQPLIVSLALPADAASDLPAVEIPDDEQGQWRTLAERALASVVAEEAEASLSLLTGFSRQLSEASDLPAVLKGVSHGLSAAAGAAAVVYLRSEAQPDVLQLVADSGIARPSLRDYRRRDIADPTSPNAVAMRAAEPLWIESPCQMEARFPQLAAARSSMQALAIVPLLSEGEALGTVAFSYDHPRRFRGTDRTFLSGLADLAAQAIVRARVREREQHLVATLQRAVLPVEIPVVAGLEIAARYLPADEAAGVGGDWWDAFTLPDGRVGFAVGDVAGHGLPAAGAMAKLRNALRAYLFAGYSPGEGLGLVEALLETTGRDVIATAAAAVYDPASGLLTWAEAGHLPPLCISDGRATYLRGRNRELLIGAGRGQARTSQDTALPAGSVVVLYTDGLIEGRRRDVEAGLALLQEVARQVDTDDLDAMCDELIERVAVSGDDICVLAVRPD